MESEDTPTAGTELDRALKKLVEEVRSGVEHGFFECSVTCEIVNGRKRRLVIRAGKSHRYVIGEEEINK